MVRRSKIQFELAFSERARGEAPNRPAGGTETVAASAIVENPAATAGPCMESIVERDDLKEALARASDHFRKSLRLASVAPVRAA